MKDITVQRRNATLRNLRVGLLVFIFVASIIGATVALTHTPILSRLTTTKLIYSQSALLSETWSTYKADSIENGSGRTLDNHTTNITSSNAQSLTMLRSVWIDDKATFDTSWNWSKANEQLPNHLFASTYGQRANGTYGDISSATDSNADTNIALSLLMAYSRYNDRQYLTDAEAIINSLYENTVVSANGSPIMASSSVPQEATSVELNPAAMNIAAYREFAKIDPSHDWTGLVNNTYVTYGAMLDANDSQLPNRATIDLTTGDITIAQQDKVFGDNGATGAWNLGFDYAWNRDARDLTLMQRLPLSNEYRTNGQILTSGTESAATYGKLMPYFKAIDPAQAMSVASSKLTSLYNQDQQAWATQLSVKDQDWAWLGIGFANGQLRQLTEDAS